MALVKDDKPYSRRGKGTKSLPESRVFDFSEDIASIRQMTERVELKIIGHIAVMEEHVREMDAIIKRLTALRLEAPNSMFVHKKNENAIIKEPGSDSKDRHEPVRKAHEKK
jgi:hypothetical protein